MRFGSDCHHLVTVDVEGLVVAQDAPRDPRQFVGQSRFQLVTLKTWGCVQKPRSEAETLPIMRTHQDDVRSLNEQGSKIFAPSPGDAAQDGSTTCAVLAGYETEPCTEISSALECFAGTNGSDHGGRDQRADARNAHEAPAVGFLLADLLNLACDRLDPLIELYPVFVEANDQIAHPR